MDFLISHIQAYSLFSLYSLFTIKNIEIEGESNPDHEKIGSSKYGRFGKMHIFLAKK